MINSVTFTTIVHENQLTSLLCTTCPTVATGRMVETSAVHREFSNVKEDTCTLYTLPLIQSFNTGI